MEAEITLFKPGTGPTARLGYVNNIEYPMPEQFRALRNRIEGFQTEMRQEFGDAKHRINRLKQRVDSIERRLEILPAE